jgi:protein ATS1
LWGCGDGSLGQLGPRYTYSVRDAGASTSVLRLLEIPMETLGGYIYRLIASSWETSYVVLSCPDRNDVLLSMGADDFGNLGVGGSKKPDRELVHVVNFDRILPPETVRFVVGSLSAGLHHVIVNLRATLADGSTRDLTTGWGISRHGQLGKSLMPMHDSTPRVIDLGDNYDPIISLALGSQHSVLMHESGRTSGLGSNKKNQLRGIDEQNNVRALSCTWNGTYIIVKNGGELQILATGSHSKGQLGRIIPANPNSPEDTSLDEVQFPFTSSTHRLISMTCGSEHVLALFEVPFPTAAQDVETEVWGWGWNEHGNLGSGTTEDFVLPRKIWPNVALNTQMTAVGIWAGCGTSWIAIQQRSR